MKTMEADVIVVAAGPAGLAAAITAGENDLKAIVFEKSNTTGGAANMGMGPLGIGTKYQKKAFCDITVDEALNKHMEYTHYRVDSDLVQTYFNKSADTIEWLEDMGVEFAGAFRYFRESEATWHIVKPENGVIGPRAAGPMVRAMTEKAKELGAEIYLETPATGLIMEDGKCVGVKAVDKNGEEIEARGKAVVVATGGFGTNKEMIKENFGYDLWENYFPFNVPGTTGDGLNMMWDAGAQKFDETRGFKFISYAVWWIRQSILQAISEQSRIVRMPLNQVGFQSKLSKAIVNFEQQFERRPSVGELAELLDTDVSKVQEALGTNGKKVSVDAPFAEDDSNSLIDVMTDDSAPGTDNQMEKESLSSDLDAALKTLTDRERQVLKMLFGIGRNEMTAEEVANTLNLTRERVRQIKERALRRLREADNINILTKYLG